MLLIIIYLCYSAALFKGGSRIWRGGGGGGGGGGGIVWVYLKYDYFFIVYIYLKCDIFQKRFLIQYPHLYDIVIKIIFGKLLVGGGL